MARHNVTVNLPQRELGNANTEFKIKRNNRVIGTLKVSKGNIEWVPRDCSTGFKCDWTEFESLMQSHASHRRMATTAQRRHATAAPEPRAVTPPSPPPPPPPPTPPVGNIPRHPQNPYRVGSGYGLAFDILAANPAGIVRDDLTAEYARLKGKPLKNAGYDVAVVLSPESENTASRRHQSCRPGYGIRKQGDRYQVVL